MISLDAIIVQDSKLITATVDGEVAMLSMAAGAYFGLDAIGTEIWNRLREPRRLGDLCEELAQDFDVDKEILVRDVSRFVETLLGQQLLLIAPTRNTT